MQHRLLTLRVPATQVPLAEALLTLAGADSISLRDAADDPVLEPEPGTTPLWPEVTMQAAFPADADVGALRTMLRTECAAEDVHASTLELADWQPKLRQAFGPRAIGTRLWLAPAGAGPAPRGRATVALHMGLAFGTGEHPTTALCLDWLDANTAAGSTIVDYGCGSGVLALTALALGTRRAWAVDNDEQALTATRANAALNALTERLFVGRPEELPAVAADVLVANILARPLIELAPTLAARVAPGGQIVLSGILAAQAARVATAYADTFTSFEQATSAGWVRLSAARKGG